MRFPPELAPRLVWVYQWHNWRRIHGSRLLCSERMRAPGVISLSLTTYNPYITSLVVNTTDGWTTARGAFTFYGIKVRTNLGTADVPRVLVAIAPRTARRASAARRSFSSAAAYRGGGAAARAGRLATRHHL